MRVRLDARSWLLAAFAAWALGCAFAALRFGGRYTLLPDDPSKAKPLPALVAARDRAPIGPLETYAEAANRPLFSADRKPVAVHIAGSPSAAQALNVILTSVILTPTLQMAIVQDNTTKESLRVKQGEPLGGAYSGWKLVGMTPRSVVFDGGSQGQTTLELRVFDGHGGEEPTRMGLTPQAIASGVLGAAPQPPGAPTPGVVPVVTPDEPSPVEANAAPDDATNAPDAAANAAANAAAADAARQAEQIRQRIEQRRQQMQAEGADATPPPDKVK